MYNITMMMIMIISCQPLLSNPFRFICIGLCRLILTKSVLFELKKQFSLKDANEIALLLYRSRLVSIECVMSIHPCILFPFLFLVKKIFQEKLQTVSDRTLRCEFMCVCMCLGERLSSLF